MFLLSRSFFLPLSLFLFFCFSFFRLTISISTCLSLSLSVFPPLFVCLSVFPYVAKERSSRSLLSLSASRKGGIGDETMEESLTITDSKTPCSPMLLDPLSFSPFRKISFIKAHTGCVVTERCVPYYLRNSTVLLLLLSEVHVVLKRISFHPLLGSKPFSVKVNVNVVTELR